MPQTKTKSKDDRIESKSDPASVHSCTQLTEILSCLFPEYDGATECDNKLVPPRAMIFGGRTWFIAYDSDRREETPGVSSKNASTTKL